MIYTEAPCGWVGGRNYKLFSTKRATSLSYNGCETGPIGIKKRWLSHDSWLWKCLAAVDFYCQAFAGAFQEVRHASRLPLSRNPQGRRVSVGRAVSHGGYAHAKFRQEVRGMSDEELHGVIAESRLGLQSGRRHREAEADASSPAGEVPKEEAFGREQV